MANGVGRGAVCITCHNIKDWKPSAHALSRAVWNGRGVNPWPHTKYPSVAENACASCHASHTAQTQQRLLNFQTELDALMRQVKNGIMTIETNQREPKEPLS